MTKNVNVNVLTINIQIVCLWKLYIQEDNINILPVGDFKKTTKKLQPQFQKSFDG